MSSGIHTQKIAIGPLFLGGGSPLLVIAGPCVVETESATLRCAEELAEVAQRLSLPLVFKASYDKSNRTSVQSFRGPGITEGLRILAKVRRATGLPLLSDVHSIEQVAPAAEVLDVLQIPAFLCRQTDLVVAAARTGRTINIKKGQFLAPWDMKNVLGKALAAGNEMVFLTERGSSFGYNNLVVDMRSLPIMRSLGCPVVFDATHSVQLPGGAGDASGGQREFVEPLARSAVAAGVDGLFVEVHEDPSLARCDGPNSVALAALPEMLAKLMEIDAVVR